MSVFRVQKTENYTVMSNHHLRNENLSLKAKGLLSQMLSLPDNWDYSLLGLAKINRDQVTSVKSAVAFYLIPKLYGIFTATVHFFIKYRLAHQHERPKTLWFSACCLTVTYVYITQYMWARVYGEEICLRSLVIEL